MKLKDVILLIITTVAFAYMAGFVFILSVIDIRNTLTCALWCVCGIWLFLFFYANMRDDIHDRRKGNRKIR